MTEIKKFNLESTLVDLNGSVRGILVDLDLTWYGRPRSRPPASHLYWQSDEMLEDVARILELPNLAAPEGYRFGPHEKWPEAYGFWQKPK